MEIGIGLPNTVPGTTPQQLKDWARAATDADTVQGYISAFESAGCDELIIFPSSGDPGQVGLLAEAAGLWGKVA